MDEPRLTPDELDKKLRALVYEMGKIEEELNRYRAQDRHVMKSEEVRWKELGENKEGKEPGGAIRRASLISPELGFNIHNFHLFLAEIPPGRQEGAYHMHGEAVKYYLSGEGIELIGDKEYRVKAGDSIFIPANTWHGTQNPGTEPLRFLAVAHSGLGVPVCVQSVFKVRQDMVGLFTHR